MSRRRPSHSQQLQDAMQDPYSRDTRHTHSRPLHELMHDSGNEEQRKARVELLSFPSPPPSAAPSSAAASPLLLSRTTPLSSSPSPLLYSRRSEVPRSSSSRVAKAEVLDPLLLSPPLLAFSVSPQSASPSLSSAREGGSSSSDSSVSISAGARRAGSISPSYLDEYTARSESEGEGEEEQEEEAQRMRYEEAQGDHQPPHNDEEYSCPSARHQREAQADAPEAAERAAFRRARAAAMNRRGRRSNAVLTPPFAAMLSPTTAAASSPAVAASGASAVPSVSSTTASSPAHLPRLHEMMFSRQSPEFSPQACSAFAESVAASPASSLLVPMELEPSSWLSASSPFDAEPSSAPVVSSRSWSLNRASEQPAFSHVSSTALHSILSAPSSRGAGSGSGSILNTHFFSPYGTHRAPAPSATASAASASAGAASQPPWFSLSSACQPPPTDSRFDDPSSSSASSGLDLADSLRDSKRQRTVKAIRTASASPSYRDLNPPSLVPLPPHTSLSSFMRRMGPSSSAYLTSASYRHGRSAFSSHPTTALLSAASMAPSHNSSFNFSANADSRDLRSASFGDSFSQLLGETVAAGASCGRALMPQEPMQERPMTTASPPAAAVSSAPAASSSSPPPAPPLHSVPANYLKSARDQLDTASIIRLIQRLYGFTAEEYGHRTFGHSCVSREEMQLAASQRHDLLYGECLPIGATKLFDADHLHARSATSLCDLGSGLGKLAIQAFLQFPNLTRVFGCELSSSRFSKSQQAVEELRNMKERLRSKLALQAQQRRTRTPTMEQEEESKHEMRSTATTILPELSLHIDHDESNAICGVRYVESLRVPGRTLTRAAASALEAALAHSESMRHSTSNIDPDWSDLQVLEASVEEYVAESLDSDGVQSSASPPLRSTSSTSSASSSSASPPALRSRVFSSPSGSSRSKSHAAVSLPCAPLRSLEFKCLNLFELEEATTADIVICETKFTEDAYPDLCKFLCRMKRGCRLLSYENLDAVFQRVYGNVPDPSSSEAKEDEPVRAHTSATAASQAPTTLAAPSPATGRREKRKRETKRTRAASAASAAASVSAAPGEGTSEAEGPHSTSSSPASASTSASSSAAAPVPMALPSSAAASSGTSAAATAAAPVVGPHPLNPFRQLSVNLAKTDRFYTTWATTWGHHFFLWTKET